MQDKGISETTFPRLLNDGTPTPAGIVAIFMAGVLVLAMINVVNRADTTTDIVDLQLKWNGGANSGTVTIELYPDLAPIHVETSNSSSKTGTTTAPSSTGSLTTS